ncbi:protein COFACTOR ASSEMBLY OF COMPLEX C SUBUNIT B CCB4, chloroplastic isoform X2 [Durio zibethinus]|nr:protein COFACTOR ASSEMBLY OF COMPLEX C SUBUNIT B CCB4, chloroplastic isoform X2 [Durio zibethinus]
MEAGRILHIGMPWTPGCPHPLPPPLPKFPRFIRASSIQRESYKGPKPSRGWIADWVSKNDDAVRSLPIYVGGASLLAVLFNRAVSGIAPVADASSSQSRADLLTLGLAVTNILTGLVWLSIRPKSITPVDPQGVECQVIYCHLPESVVSEIFWAWESLSAVTCCRSLVIVYNCQCIAQIGVAAKLRNDEPFAVDAAKLMQGSLCQGVLKSGAQSYLANLSLYPGRSELPFLPSNTQ